MNPKCSLHFIFQKTLGNIQTTEFELMSRSFGKNLMIYNSLVNRLFIRNSTLLNKSKEIILNILFFNTFINFCDIIGFKRKSFLLILFFW